MINFDLLCYLRDSEICVTVNQDFFGDRTVSGFITYVSKKYVDNGGL